MLNTKINCYKYIGSLLFYMLISLNRYSFTF